MNFRSQYLNTLSSPLIVLQILLIALLALPLTASASTDSSLKVETSIINPVRKQLKEAIGSSDKNTELNPKNRLEKQLSTWSKQYGDRVIPALLTLVQDPYLTAVS